MPSWTDGRAVDRGDGGRRVLRPLCRFRAVRSLAWIGLVSTAGCGGARAGIEDTNAPSGARLITDLAIASAVMSLAAPDAVRADRAGGPAQPAGRPAPPSPPRLARP